MKLYIIPGYKETVRQYGWLISVAKKKKYVVEFLNLQLTNNSLLELSRTKVDKNSVVFGFSTGALIAYKLKTSVAKGIYCSMSEILGPDAKTNAVVTEMIKLFGKKTTDELRKMRYGKSKAKKFVQFCGDREITPRIFKLGKVTIIPNTGHKLSKAYREAILREL